MRCLQELERLRASLSGANRDKLQLKQKTQLLDKSNGALRQCEWEKEVLLQKNEKLQQEYDALHRYRLSSESCCPCFAMQTLAIAMQQAT
jgi:hypothetical protein